MTITDEETNHQRDESNRLREEFFYLVGYSITRWAFVDRALFELCRYALNTSEEKTAAIFYRSPQIGDHLVLVEKLLALSISSARFEEWRKVRNKVDKLLEFRNFIAHHPVTGVVQLTGVLINLNSDPSSTPSDREHTIQPPKQWWEFRPEPKKLLAKTVKFDVVKREDLVSHANDVNELLGNLAELGKTLPKRSLKKPPKSSRPGSPSPPDQDRKRHRTREQPRRRPRSSPA